MNLADDFDRNGWAIARGVITENEIATMNAIFASVIPDDSAWPSARDGSLGEVSGASLGNEALARIVRDSRFGALAAAALDTARVQLLQDSLLYKPAREGGSVEWHQDYTYLGFLTPPQIVTLRVALLPESLDSGCMVVVSGSHRWGSVGDIRVMTEASVDSVEQALSAEQRDALKCATPVVLEPGDVSLHHCLTVHGSGPNRGDRPRRTVILRMFGTDARLDAARLPRGATEHFPADAHGRLAESAFPVV